MPQRSGLEAQLRERAQRDPEFRARMIADPKGTVSAALDIELPDEFSIRVIEEQPGEVVVTLPPAAEGEHELTDAELAASTGGGCWGAHTSCASGCTPPSCTMAD